MHYRCVHSRIYYGTFAMSFCDKFNDFCIHNAFKKEVNNGLMI